MGEFWLDATAAVLNSMWQGALLAATAWLVLRWAMRLHPGLRHLAWLAVFSAVAALPLGVWIVPGTVPDFTAPPASMGQGKSEPVVLRDVLEAVAIPSMADKTQPPLTEKEQALGEISALWAPWLLAAWAGVSIVLLVRVGRRVHALHGIKRASCEATGELAEAADSWLRDLGPGRKARLLLSDEVEAPMLAGFGHAAVILPKTLAIRLTTEEVRAVWLHEMAHLRRNDDWLELAEQLAVAFFPVQPALLFIKRQADHAREEACDAWVVERTDDGLSYAECLLKLAEWRFTKGAAAAGLSMMGATKRIHRRIDMLLREDGGLRPAVSRAILSVFLLLMAVSAGILVQTPPAIVFAQGAEEAVPAAPESPDAAPEPPSPSAEPESGLPPAPSADIAPQPPAPPVVPGRSADLFVAPAPVTPAVPPVQRVAPFGVAVAPVVPQPVAVAASPQPPSPPGPFAGAPMPRPQAVPDDQPAPAAAPAPEDHRDLQSLSEELASLATQMKEIHLEKMAPLQAAVQESAKKLAEQIHTEFGPQQARIAEVAAEIAALAAKGESTTAAQEQLEAQVREMETALRPAQEKLRETAAAIRISEQQMREVEQAMRHIEREMRGRAVLIQKRAGQAMLKQALKESNKEAKALRMKENALRKEGKDKP